jgi:hypothetical protein
MIDREANTFLRIFGSPHESLAKANADLARLTEALASGQQHAALWALMDCSITVFHTGDWIRATHADHHQSSRDLAANSKWLRMVRDIGNAAKHGDLTWKPADAETHGAVLAQLQYKIDGHSSATSHHIVALAKDGTSYDVVDVLREAIAQWRSFVKATGF